MSSEELNRLENLLGELAENVRLLSVNNRILSKFCEKQSSINITLRDGINDTLARLTELEEYLTREAIGKSRVH